MTILEKIAKVCFGDPHEKKVKLYQPFVGQINQLEPAIQVLSDEELQQKTAVFRARLQKGEALDAILPEAFAVVREAAVRTVKMRHFDVQLIGGVVLHEGKISEMKTGEGKTLVSTLPAYLNALEQKGVYIVTVNDYLAKRDRFWMGQIYEFLGLTVGLIQSGMDPEERREAYNCDITFGTNNEFGFDYLRDNLVTDYDQCCQTRRHYAIIDEVDSILIDEARTPLIISGPVQDSTSRYKNVAKIVRRLQKEADFTLDEKHKNVVLTEEGIAKIEEEMGMDNIYSIQNMEVAHMAVNLLRALYLFKRDVDYVVKDGEVLIVDEFTGRILQGRRYSDGLHQSIEAIESLKIKEESQTLAGITFQNYFRMFPKLAGMTGTAVTEESEFNKIYGLEVVVIPTHKPMIRKDLPDLVYKTREEKFKAITREVKTLYEKEQPVLLGTITIEASEVLSGLLKQAGVPHSVLNAKFHEKEAEIIAKAGQKKMVTIATNMAGRGTDIVLGVGVADIGGLCVIGSERHESRRIDNQLRGRSGRQGDQGISRFYVSLSDDLMRLFGSDRIARVMDTLGVPADTPIEHPLISRSIEKAQTKVEQYHFSIRKQILQYDDVMNKQRETVYELRYRLLKKVNLDTKIKDMIRELIESLSFEILGESDQLDSKLDWAPFYDRLSKVFPIERIDQFHVGIKEKKAFFQKIIATCYEFYLAKKARYPQEIFEEIIKEILLHSLDRKWRDHLHNMEVLREGIGLRAWGQRDPLVEYKIEAFDMFTELLSNMAEESLTAITHFELVQSLPQKEAATIPMNYNRSENGVQQPKRRSDQDKLGRNDVCPCGSGRKFKKCCMK